ncbi:MAG: PHP domain-containing protein [Anaerolineae bacterium]|nr:PHP domain-containing protein [Anaerolineae bacterium]
MRIDLHIHSTASDGCWSPEQIVEQVKKTGINFFAIADHDTIDSVLAGERLAKENQIAFIRAVEVSTTLAGLIVHILAYGIDLESKPFLEMIDENRKKLESVDEQSIQKLIDARHDVTWEAFDQYQNDPSRGGWKALNFMIDRGICSGVKDFFGRVFVGDMALEYPIFADPVEAVRVIQQAGGTAIWAHPGNNLDHIENGSHLLAQMRDLGVQGLECYSPYHDQATTQRCLDFCRQHDLLITAGSDCHGGFAGRTLGIPEAYLQDLNLGSLLD